MRIQSFCAENPEVSIQVDDLSAGLTILHGSRENVDVVAQALAREQLDHRWHREIQWTPAAASPTGPLVVDFMHAPTLESLVTAVSSSSVSRSTVSSSTMSPLGEICCPVAPPDGDCWRHGGGRTQKVDLAELVRDRDRMAERLENRIADERRNGERIQMELGRVRNELAARQERAEDLGRQLRAVDAELTAIELRHQCLDDITFSPAANDADRIRQLDEQLAFCQESLHQLDARESALRGRMAKLDSGDCAGMKEHLMRQRSHLKSIERLLDELQPQIARLGRGDELACVCRDAHDRMAPTGEMLRTQLYALCNLLSEQETIAQRRDLLAELQHLSRAQADFRDQAELLAEQKRSLCCHGDYNIRRAKHESAPAATDHCHCSSHAHHRVRVESLAEDADRRTVLLQQQAGLREQLAGCRRELAALRAESSDLERQAADLIDSDEVSRLQDELQRLRGKISGVGEASPQHSPELLSVASEYLASTHHDRLAGFDQDPSGRVLVVDRTGAAHGTHALDDADRRLILVCLALAHGAVRPTTLVLVHPLAELPDHHVAAIARLLHDRSADQQLLVLTSSHDETGQFGTFGAAVRLLRSSSRQPFVERPAEQPERVEEKRVDVLSFATGQAGTVGGEAGTDGEARSGDGAGAFDRGAINDYRTRPEPKCRLRLMDPVTSVPFLREEATAALQENGIQTVELLINADPDELAERLRMTQADGDTISRWQSQATLMCFVPGVTASDSRLLAECGIADPGGLFDLEDDELHERISQFVSSDAGRQFASRQSRYSRRRSGGWIRGARSNRNRWQRYRKRSNWSQRRNRSRRATSKHTERERTERQHTERQHTDRPRTDRPRTERQHDSRPRRGDESGVRHETRGGESLARSGRSSASFAGASHAQSSSVSSSSMSPSASSSSPTSGGWGFNLELTSDVEAAPSIGPITASRLAKIGIYTVDDLFRADPDETAKLLKNRRISANRVLDWQQQARIMCQVPNLRGHDAQVLVACGITDADDLAATNADLLWSVVGPFVETNQGKRIIRNGRKPDLNEVGNWVKWAARRRPLKAA